MFKNRKTKMFKPTLLTFSMLAIVLCIVGTAIAFIIDSKSVTNTFTPSEVTCAVVETIGTSDPAVKTNVKIQNTGDTDAYIRAMVVVTWKDAQGNVYGKSQPVAGTDYTISYGNNWTKIDDIYYYNGVVNPTNTTKNLIKTCTNIGTAPEGYNLSLEIIADAIQATDAAKTAAGWEN